VAGKYGFDYCTTDYTELLNDEDIDVVLITTRHNLHAPMTIEALKAGKDVFVEKPLAMNIEELSELISAVDENPGQVMVGFNRRFSPFTTYAKELFGPINEAVVVSCRVNAGYVSKDSWIHDPKQGGGRIIGEVCHFVDLIQYLSDSLPESVYAEHISGTNEAMPDRDNVAITIKLRNGSVGSIIYVADGDKSYPREKVELFGKGSVAVIDNFRSMRFIKNGKTRKKRNYLSIDRGHTGEMNALFISIKEGKDLPVDFEEYVYTTLATFKIVESINEGKAMHVDLSEL